jgi:hypothetical protein
MPVGSADQEARLAPSIVPPGFELPCKFHRRQCLAALVENDGDAIGRRIRQIAPLVGQLGHFGRPLDAF